MSYCRFSSDDCKSNVHCYEDVGGGYTTRIAGSRHVGEVPVLDWSSKEALGMPENELCTVNRDCASTRRSTYLLPENLTCRGRLRYSRAGRSSNRAQAHRQGSNFESRKGLVRERSVDTAVLWRIPSVPLPRQIVEVSSANYAARRIIPQSTHQF